MKSQKIPSGMKAPMKEVAGIMYKAEDREKNAHRTRPDQPIHFHFFRITAAMIANPAKLPAKL
jgi:hypothetical protein